MSAAPRKIAEECAAARFADDPLLDRLRVQRRCKTEPYEETDVTSPLSVYGENEARRSMTHHRQWHSACDSADDLGVRHPRARTSCGPSFAWRKKKKNCASSAISSARRRGRARWRKRRPSSFRAVDGAQFGDREVVQRAVSLHCRRAHIVGGLCQGDSRGLRRAAGLACRNWRVWR